MLFKNRNKKIQNVDKYEEKLMHRTNDSEIMDKYKKAFIYKIKKSYQPYSISNNLRKTIEYLPKSEFFIEYTDEHTDFSWDTYISILHIVVDQNMKSFFELSLSDLKKNMEKLLVSSSNEGLYTLGYYNDNHYFLENIVIDIRNKENLQQIEIDLNEKIKMISTRGADFDNMTLDERLKELSNLLENMLKINGKFIDIDYTNVFLDYITNDKVKEYRNLIHCFRHATEEALQERKIYTEKQKKFLVDYGIILVNHIYLNTK